MYYFLKFLHQLRLGRNQLNIEFWVLWIISLHLNVCCHPESLHYCYEVSWGNNPNLPTIMQLLLHNSEITEA